MHAGPGAYATDQAGSAIRLFLAGDIMPARGIDQILPHPSPPELREPWVRDARHYVALAESANGAVPRAVSPDYLWGPTLDELARRQPQLRIVNLETSVTRSRNFWPKGINYRLHPDNAAAVAAIADCCVLANNHVLDFGRDGLAETLTRLHALGLRTAGAGPDRLAAQAPAVFSLGERHRVLVYAAATPDCGVPPEWAATARRAGVFMLHERPQDAERLSASIAQQRRDGDVVILSIHWGDNWNFDITDEQRTFAHTLIDAGAVDLVHGHSSHHVKAIERYRGKLILYGCGDYLNDYEGIGGHEAFGAQLGLMYFPLIEATSGRLLSLEMVPIRIRHLRIEPALAADRQWLHTTLMRECGRLGLVPALREDGVFVLPGAH